MAAVDTTGFLNHEGTPIVFFKLETSGFSASCDILQITMKFSDAIFDEYINPRGPIDKQASNLHGLTIEEWQLFQHGQPQASRPLREVLEQLLQYLRRFEAPCVLVAYNCAFHVPRLIRVFNEENLLEELRKVVNGFTDTLKLVRKKFPDSKDNTLSTLANETPSLPSEIINGAHLLEKFALHRFTSEELISARESFDDTVTNILKAARSKEILLTLKPLKNYISEGILKRIADAGITYELILTTHRNEGPKETIKLLERRDEDGKAQVIKSKKVVDNIIKHFEEM